MKLLSSSYLLSRDEVPAVLDCLEREKFRIGSGLSRFSRREIYHDSAPGRPLGYFENDATQTKLHVLNPEGNPLSGFVDRYRSLRREEDPSEISS